jgi:menaquinone-dependent protoporphyrinogen oxidase
MRVLVGYASAHGSTQSIATRIAQGLRKRGIDVEITPLDTAASVGAHDACVLGSAIHDQAWLAPAVEFLTRNADALAARPVWLFSVGMPAALGKTLQRIAASEAGKVVAGLPAAIRPRGHRLFSGVVTRAQLPWIGRVFFRALGGHFGDFRDWQDIDAWADEIAQALEHASSLAALPG